MPDPDAVTLFTAIQDQQAAMMRPVADNVASYFKQLRKNGLSRSEAGELAAAYQERVFDTIGLAPRDSD